MNTLSLLVEGAAYWRNSPKLKPLSRTRVCSKKHKLKKYSVFSDIKSLIIYNE